MRVALLVALLVCSLAAPAGVASPPPESPPAVSTDGGVSDTQRNGTAPNVSRVLTFPPGADRTNTLRTVQLDAGGGTSVESAVTGVRLETRAAQLRINETIGDDRAAAIRQEVRRLETAASELRANQESLLRAHTDGELTDRQLVVGLARVHAVAGVLQDRAGFLSRTADRTGSVNESVSVRADTVRLELGSLRGPVRDRALAALRGESAGTRVFVATTERGVVFSTIDNGTYLREAYLGFPWDQGDGAISASAAENATAASYPEIWSARSARSGTGLGSTFELSVPHAGGQLDVYVRGNEEVARAVQRVPLDAFPSGNTAVQGSSGLNLTVNRTYPGGPMQIRVVDVNTGEPVDANIVLQLGVRPNAPFVVLGETGPDGELWTLSPADSFIITADSVGDPRVVQLRNESADPVTVRQARSESVTRPQLVR